MAQRTKQNFPLTVPLFQSNPQITSIRHQKEWRCPICGAIFDQEQTKDIHMASCKRNSHPQQFHNYPVVDNPITASQPVTLCLHTQQYSEELSYISDMGETCPLVWNRSKSLYTARVSLKPGQNKGRVHFMSADKYVLVESFEVPKYPTINSNIEILLRGNVAIPNPIKSPKSNYHHNTAPRHPQPFQKNYQDDDIYANVSEIADKIRLSYEVDQLKERVKVLENENTKLKEENTKSKNIIDDFYTKNRELESELTRLKKARGFENNLRPLVPPTKPVISPRPDKQRT